MTTTTKLTFSPTAGSLPESQTLAITARAKRMKAEGIDVAPFAAGEPDFDTPDHIKEAGIQALRDGRTKYSAVPGIPALREAVAKKFQANGIADCTFDRTIVSSGAKGIIYFALQVLLNPGEEVIVPTPDWLSYPNMVQAAGGKTVLVDTKPEDGYIIDPDKIRAAVTPKSRALILNSPGNPTGAVQPDEVMAEIGRICAEHGILVISDEIYEHLVYAPATFKSFAEVAPDAADLTLLVNGVSKAYSMTGWRIGYGAGPKELIQRMTRIQSHATSGTPEFCQRAAIAALEGPTDFLAMLQDAFGKRREIMCDTLATVDGLACRKPDGAFYVFPDVSALLGKSYKGQKVDDVSTMAELIIEHARAAVVPGNVFDAPYAIRFSYACSEDDIRAGLERVVAFFGELE